MSASGLAHLRHLVPLGVRRGGIGGHESAEGRARGGSDEALAERRGDAPPDGPGKHSGAGEGRDGRVRRGGTAEVRSEVVVVLYSKKVEAALTLQQTHNRP